MSFQIVLTYSNVFDQETPDLKLIIDDRLATNYIFSLAKINSELYPNQYDYDLQKEILKRVLAKQEKSLKYLVYNKLLNIKKLNKGQSPLIFSNKIILEFMNFLLSNFNLNSSYITNNANQEEELIFFKAYLTFVEHETNRIKISEESKSRQEFYRKNLWPIYLNQLENNESTYYVYSFFKCLAFFSFLKKKLQLFLRKLFEQL